MASDARPLPVAASDHTGGVDALVAVYCGAVVLAILCDAANEHQSWCQRCRAHGIEVLDNVPVAELDTITPAARTLLALREKLNIMYLKRYDDADMLEATGGVHGFDAGFSLARIVHDHMSQALPLSKTTVESILDAADTLVAIGELDGDAVAALRGHAS